LRELPLNQQVCYFPETAQFWKFVFSPFPRTDLAF